MNESLDSHNENVNNETSDKFQSLMNMGNSFNPEQAKKIADQEKMEISKVGDGQAESVSLRTIEREKPVGEMTEAEIAEEYLDLIYDLGQNFTGPEASKSRVIDSDGNIRHMSYSGQDRKIRKILSKFNEQASKEIPQPGLSNYENKYLDRALNLSMVDDIIEAESEWRDAKEKYENAMNQQMSGEELDKIKTQTGYANRHLMDKLSWAYSPDSRYGYHKTASEQENESYNAMFFSEDRMSKINRAIELRNQLNGKKQNTESSSAADEVVVQKPIENREASTDKIEKIGSQISPEEVDSLFISLEDRFGIDKNNPKNREMLGRLLGAENKRQELLEYADAQTTDYDRWNALTNAERIRRSSDQLIYDLLPGTYDSNDGFEDGMVKVERIRRQILASPEVKALDEDNADTGYGIKNTYHEFIEPTREDVDSPTFDEYKKQNTAGQKVAEGKKPSTNRKLKNFFSRIVGK